MPRGRPKKTNDEGTPEQVSKRNYMRQYTSEIKQGIVNLEQAERDCLAELEQIRKERNKLINMLGSANTQASTILKEAVGKKH